MITNKIEKLQDHLNSIIVSKDIDYEEVLKVSRELDELIIQYYKAPPGE